MKGITKEELSEAVEFLKENGLNEDSYIARNVKNFMNSLNDPDDNSEELSLEFREQLDVVIKAGMELPTLLQAERERYAKSLIDLDFDTEYALEEFRTIQEEHFDKSGKSYRAGVISHHTMELMLKIINGFDDYVKAIGR